ncbi:MAG: peptidylprolyl isomerase [Verrucomicrobiia bacterium]
MTKRLAVALISVIALAGSVGAQEKSKPARTPVRNANAPASEPTANPAEVVARVNGTEITRKDLDAAKQELLMQLQMRGQYVPPEKQADFESQVLEQLIGRDLLLQEGQNNKSADLETRVKQQVSSTKAKLGEGDYFKALKEEGLTEEQYVRRLRDNMIVQDTIRAIVEKQSKIAPEEVKAFYETNRAHFYQPEEVRASHILIQVPPDATPQIKTQKLAQIEAVRSLLKQGGNFAELAKKFSEDTTTAASGGDLNYFPRGSMVPEFDAAAFSLPTNEVSNVVTTKYGYHLLMVTDRKPSHEMSFGEVKANIEKYLLANQGVEVVRKHVQDLRAKAKIEVLIKSLSSATLSPGADKPVAKP